MLHKHHIVPKYEQGVNQKENLVLLTPTQHAMWHYAEWLRKGQEEDRIAWRGLTGLIDSPQATLEAIKLGSERARQKREENNPNWGKEFSKSGIEKQQWLRENDPEWKQREVEQLTTLAHEYGHLGGRAGKGKGWWYNEGTGEVTRSVEQPGPEWRVGKKPLTEETKLLHSQNNTGSCFYNNGVISCRSKEHPGEGWVRGRLPHKKTRVKRVRRNIQ